VGDDVADVVAERVQALLEAAGTQVDRVEPEAWEALDGERPLLALGQTPLLPQLVAPAELDAAGDEALVVRSGIVEGQEVVVAAGSGRLATHFACYALLERLGFGFLHPLAPLIPQPPLLPDVIDLAESPRWPVRGVHLHTMHPIELTELLNGFGEGGADDEQGFQAGQGEWSSTLEWLVANRQNRVEWVLLESAAWSDFATSETRRRRLAQLCQAAHEFGLLVGIDAPLVLAQQHAFRLIPQRGTLDEELSQLHDRVDWLMSAGFDYLSTENGASEFTHDEADRMLAWMNELSRYLDEAYPGRQALVKLHCSTGQPLDGYPDPDTGAPLDVNLLPHYADTRLGVMPHSVQHYGLDDPAPTYGNRDFANVRREVALEAGRRLTVFYPESAYWVSFDADVPLLLPVYAHRRVHDLRLLAADEEAGRLGRGEQAGAGMDGQMLFSSGWEWGYWLNDVVAARAAWDPHLEAQDDDQAVREILSEVLAPLGEAQAPLSGALVDLMTAERELLIEGRVGGVAPADIVRRNGQAYLQGYDAWDDVTDAASGLPGLPHLQTQPVRLGLVDLRNPLGSGPSYRRDIEPLLAEMERRLAASADALARAGAAVPPEAAALAQDLVDGARLTALRAAQVHGLYDYVDSYWLSWGGVTTTWRYQRLASARAALDAAWQIARVHEVLYRVPAGRIADWRPGATAYAFRYLWTVRTLYYWWRDEVKAVDVPLSPCVLNVINPVDVGLGEGMLASALRLLRALGDWLPGVGRLTECLAEPPSEPTLPPAGLR
jgi:hypothetical protein